MSADVSGALAGLLAQARQSWPVTGAAACVVDRSGEIAVEFSGFADAATGVPVGAHTRFEIGSISKTCTGIVLLHLAEHGLVDLAAPVTRYLPWFAVRSRFAPITVRHLLHHTAGLITGSDALPDALAHAYLLRDTETGSAPGELFHYSNVGYVLLGLLVEQVTGCPLADVVTDVLLRPLGMAESSARITAADHPLLATGYQSLHTDRPLLPGDPLIPATWLEVAAADGNVAATAADLGRYARMLLGRGELDGIRVLDPGSFERMVTDLAAGGEPSAHPSRYGLGINVEQIAGHTCVTHGGGMIGYSTFLAADLDAGVGVVVLTNAPGEFPIAELIARPVLDHAVRGAAVPPIARTQVADSAVYVGTFADATHRITVSREPSGTLRLDSGGRGGTLYETGQGRLACDHPQWRQFAHRVTGTGADRVWTWGPLTLVADDAPPSALGSEPSPLAGRYRSYTPWYPDLRIVERAGRLVLIAAAGVEAHTDEPELVEVAEGEYRIGADPRTAERLVRGPVVAGRAIWVERDGCRYSRSFLG